MGSVADKTMAPRRNIILQGTFIHCKSKQELEIFHDSAIGVDSHGKIVAVEKGASDAKAAKDTILKQLGWTEDQVDVHTTGPTQFFFPGFIGKFHI